MFYLEKLDQNIIRFTNEFRYFYFLNSTYLDSDRRTEFYSLKSTHLK